MKELYIMCLHFVAVHYVPPLQTLNVQTYLFRELHKIVLIIGYRMVLDQILFLDHLHNTHTSLCFSYAATVISRLPIMCMDYGPSIIYKSNCLIFNSIPLCFCLTRIMQNPIRIPNQLQTDAWGMVPVLGPMAVPFVFSFWQIFPYNAVGITKRKKKLKKLGGVSR